jgi:hypothetical protein
MSSVDDDSEGFTVSFISCERDSLDLMFSNKVYWGSTDLTDHLTGLVYRKEYDQHRA